MAKHILKCPKCSKYTIHELCDSCGQKAVLVKPQKYSPQDKLAVYRRKAKFDQ